MASNTDYQILLMGALDEAKSKVNIDSGIQALQNKLGTLKIKVELDTSSLSNITSQIQQAMRRSGNGTNIVGQIFNTSDLDRQGHIYANRIDNIIRDINGRPIRMNTDSSGLTEMESRVRSLQNSLSNFQNIKLPQITSNINDGFYSQQIAQITERYSKLGLTIPSVQSRISSLQLAEQNLTNTITSGSASVKQKQEAMTQYNAALQNASRSVSLAASTYKSVDQVDSMIVRMQTFLSNNSAMTNGAKTNIQGLIASLQNADRVTGSMFNSVNTKFQQTAQQMREAGRLGDSFVTTIKKGAQSFSYWTSATFLVMRTVQSLKTMISTVYELDTALVDLRKTTTITDSQLQSFYLSANDVAKQMGVTTGTIIEQASSWSRLGYSTEEAATKMAKYSSMFATISPGMDENTATDGLVSTMKAYKIGMEDVDEVVDGIMSKINIIGNTQALSNSDIVDFLTRSASSMAAANNSLEETIALGTAATEITQDASSVGNMLKTVSMRIRGYDEETESYSEELENLSGTIADLTKTASTPGGISLFTDSTKTEYKSTYQILKDISTIYDDLTDKNQAQLLEVLAGKRQGNAVAAIISNFDAAENSMNSMANSAGNAEAEMSIAMDSIDYKLNALKVTGEGIAQNLFTQDLIKGSLSAFTGFAEVIDFLTEKFGLLGSAMIIAATAISSKSKNFGRVKLFAL